MYCDRIAFSCESEWIIISTSHMTKCFGACSAYNHPLWDGGLAGARSLVGPQCGHKLLGPLGGARPGGRAHSPECSGVLCQDQAPSGFGEASTNSGRCYTCSRGSLAGRACSPNRSPTVGLAPSCTPCPGLAPHLTWEDGVGYRPKALLRAHRKLKGNLGSPTTAVIDTVGGRAS